MRGLILGTALALCSLCGCQSLETLWAPKSATPQLALAPLYQDLMPVVGAYYALGTTTFLPVSAADFSALQQDGTLKASPNPEISPELSALTTALRHGGASSCTSSEHCAGLQPTYITTRVLTPDDDAYVLVELKTAELTLQRLYERSSLQPLSALSIQATRAPLYDLSLLHKQSLELELLSETQVAPQATNKQAPTKQATTKPQSTKKASSNKTAPQNTTAPKKKIELPTGTKLQVAQQQSKEYERAPQGKVIEILTTKKSAQASAQPALPAAPHSVEQLLSTRAQELGMPSQQRAAASQRSGLAAGFINLQRMVPNGSLSTGQLQSGLNTALGGIDARAPQVIGTIAAAATAAHNSIAHVKSGDLSASLNAAHSLGNSVQRVTQALQTKDTPRTQGSSAESAVFATGPYQAKEE